MAVLAAGGENIWVTVLVAAVRIFEDIWVAVSVRVCEDI